MGSVYKGLSARQRRQAQNIVRGIRSGRIGIRAGNQALAALSGGTLRYERP